MSPVGCHEIVEIFPDQLAAAIAGLSGTSITASTGTQSPGPGYLVTIVAADGGRGSLFVHIEHEGAGLLARRALGATDELDVESVIEALRDMCGQAAAAVVEERRLQDVRVKVDDVEIAATVPAGEPVTLAEIEVEGEGTPVRIAMWGTLELGVSAPAFAQSEPGRPAASPRKENPDVDVILDMELPLVVRFGRTEMSLKSLTLLAPGAVIDLGRSPDDPVEVLVSNQVVARGEVVTVAGNYGVRITDIISPADRARYMEVIR